MKRPLRKRRTREHILADLSVNHVERFILPCGFTSERMDRDYGIDLEMFTFNRRGEIEPGKILIQRKASDRLHADPSVGSIPFRIARSDLVNWLGQPMPVMLAVYDAKRDVPYWLYVQSYFRKLSGFNLFAAGKSITIHLAINQTISKRSIRRFAGFRNRILEQMTEVIHDGDEHHPLR